MITRVYFLYKEALFPFLKIDESFKKEQILIIFSLEEDFHLTLHYKNNEPHLVTCYDKNKQPRTWDPEKVEIARKLGYRNPERHGNYLLHQPLYFCINKEGEKTGAHLLGIPVCLPKFFSIPNRYTKDKSYVIPVEKEKFSLNIYFSNDKNTTDIRYNKTLILREKRGKLHFDLDFSI